ncbi:thermosome subunit alpha [Halomarina ordinaria]|uniref:Thermosome subunit alpha n=1 Tax=Halomarina ordinaria TaxID=3033939 RepID=A0ABD5UAS5_9EURY|nr:thermosome subunit alpha [Halomarina sp. PSRA2]
MTHGTPGWYGRLRSAGGERLSGDEARRANLRAGRALAGTLRTTLGPRGCDKLLVGSDGVVVVTNDGASILDRMEIDHPAASLLLDVASQQADQVGDGTTSAVLLAGALLGEAESLFERGLHPTTVGEGYWRACDLALDRLPELTVETDGGDRERLVDVVRTAVTGKWTDREATHLAELAADAVLAVGEGDRVDRDRIVLHAVPGGSPTDTELVDGLVVDMAESSTTATDRADDLPRRLTDARVALVDTPLDVPTTRTTRSVAVESVDGLEALTTYETDQRDRRAAALLDAGADVVFCQQAVDEDLAGRLAAGGVFVAERTRQDELYKLARATGARLVATTADLTPTDLGRAGVVERRTVGDRDLTVVRGNAATEQVSVLLRGGTDHVVEETRRVLEDCLTVAVLAYRGDGLLPGGGATEAALAAHLRESARGLGGREALAVEAAATALEVVPRTLAENAGVPVVDALTDLRAHHAQGRSTVGIGAATGEATEMVAEGVLEPLAVKRRALACATEGATLLLRIDDVVAASAGGGGHGEEGHDHGHSHEHDHGHGGYPWALGH